MKISPPVKKPWPDSSWHILIILFFITLVSIAAYYMIQQQKQLLIEDTRNEIATIADLKSAQVVQWRKERFAEGAAIRANAMMSSRINDYIVGNDKTKIQREFKLWMASLIDHGGYSKGILFNTDGKIIASDSDLKVPPSQHYLNLVADAGKAHELILSDFHSDGLGGPYDIDLTIPIVHSDGVHTRCIAIMVLDINPAKQLYPLIQSWPTTSQTAETLLVKREGDSVLFLNDLRYRQQTTTPFLLPLTAQNMPAVRAALGQQGSFDGVDYRNIAVLSAIRTIPGTHWGIVAKIDVSEAIAPLAKSVWIVTFLGFAVIITMILGVFLWGVRRKAGTLHKLFEIEQKHNLELQRSEDSLTRSLDYHMNLLKIFPALVWRSGTDARCDYFNQTWLTFTGRTLEQELGDRWMDGVHPDDLEQRVATYMEAFRARRPFHMEYRLRYNDGNYHWINDHGTPYNGLMGSFAGYIGSCYDIDVQKTAEADLQLIRANLEKQISERTRDLTETNVLLRKEISERKQLERQLLSAKRLEAIGQIAGGVAHEVRNPLNAILTITEALFKEKEIESNPEYVPYIQHIRTQVNRLVHLMNDLLDLGRTIPANNLQPMPLYEVCRETLDLWMSTGMSSNRQGVLTLDNNDESIMVLVDRLKLQQVFFNLLENAGHHTPDSSNVMIRLTHNNHKQTDGMVIAQVIDLGVGIPEDKLAHVFEPFYTDRKGGTGLGLALVRHFIENMGGTVEIWNNSPPPGCTVEIRIPLYREESK